MYIKCPNDLGEINVGMPIARANCLTFVEGILDVVGCYTHNLASIHIYFGDRQHKVQGHIFNLP